MWLPENEEQIVQAVTSGSLKETEIFDAKAELPPRAKNKEIAKDIAAMATNGGVIIYGIGEDENGRPTKLNPIPLANQPERITAIVQTSISEPPRMSINTIPTEKDPSIGYIVVAIPASERAPHMVIVKGENRYYGRTATGNTPLTESEVARLYERRYQTEIDLDKLLQEIVDQAPLSAHPNLGYLHIFAHPTIGNQNILDLSTKSIQTNQDFLQDLIRNSQSNIQFSQKYTPRFNKLVQWKRKVHGFMGGEVPSSDKDEDAIRGTLTLQVNFDGTSRLFYGGAAFRINSDLLFFPSVVAGITTELFAFLGEIFSHAKYTGTVDMGLAITGIKDSKPYLPPGSSHIMKTLVPFDEPEYRQMIRCMVSSLRDDPEGVAKDILIPLYDAMSQSAFNLWPE